MPTLFFGDSLTAGYGDTSGLGWAGRLAAASLARGNDLTWYNLGVRGHTSKDIQSRWREETSRRTVSYEPLRIFLSLGAADIAHALSPDDTEAMTDAMLHGMTSMGDTILIGPPPSLRDDYADAVAPLDERLQRVAARHSVPYVSSLSLLSADTGYENELARTDGIHPDAAGYALWAERLLAQPSIRIMLTIQ